jgi:hypothetical protein
MNDPLLQAMADLPAAEPSPQRIARVRSRCHARLARSGSAPRRGAPRSSRVWEPIVLGLGGVYLMAILREAVHLYGVF